MTLITNEIWAIQRYLYGYKDVRPNPLMINIGHYNYIEIRTDLNSFLPNNLQNSISKKLIEFFLIKLKNNNYLHDKIEFKLIPTCFQSDLAIYLKKILTKKEILIYKKNLTDLTTRIINPKYYDNSVDNMINQLTEIKQLKCSFVIASRCIDGSLLTLKDLKLPKLFTDIFHELPVELFREDISSTKIRDNSLDKEY